MLRLLIRIVFSFFLSSSVLALELVPIERESSLRYIANIQLHTADELHTALQRAEQLYASGQFEAGRDTPIAFVLHGAEARVFFRRNYQKNKLLVDLAARLTAFQVVDVRVCETWSGSAGLDTTDLPPFVEAVPYGPDEERRLMEEEGYVYF